MRLIECVSCGETRGHGAFGLCKPCYDQRYYQEHREQKRLYKLDYYRKNQPRLVAKRRAYYQGHIEEIRAYQRKYRAEHKEELRSKAADYHRAWYKENKPKCRAKVRRRATQRARVIDTLTAEQAERLMKVGQAMYPRQQVELDHIVPLSAGGSTSRGNMQAIPVALNRSKGARLPQEVYKQVELWQNPLVEKRGLRAT